MFRKLWIQVRSSLWFVPGLLVLAAVGLALGLVEIDVTYAETLQKQRWEPLLNAGSEGARGMLTAIAGSMITVAGVAFSVTIVTFSLASTQYTPRILRNFMRDRANQFVLGIFVAIYTYCLVVLRTIRGGGEQDGSGFVPLLAVGFGMLLALLSIGCLIFFIHHVATSIQASTILKAIEAETHSALNTLFPQDLGEEEDAVQAALEMPNTTWYPIPAKASGYLQHIDSDEVMRFAEKHDVVLRLECNPGDFVGMGAPLISSARDLGSDAITPLRLLFVVADFRTIEQDAGFGVRQIVDIATKALSPGVNDTSTAVSCLDYLGAILSHLGRRHIESPFRAVGGKLRVIARVPTFADYTAKAFDEIRSFAGANVTILLHMLAVIQRIARAAPSPRRRSVLLQHARLVVELADRSVAAPHDRVLISAEIAALREVMEANQAQLATLSGERRSTELGREE